MSQSQANLPIKRAKRAAAVGAAAVMLGSLLGCDGARGTITLRIVTAPDSDIMDRVTRARLVLSEPFTEIEAERAPDGSLDLALDVIADGMAGTVSFEGLDADGATIAVGRTGLLPIAAIDAQLAIYVAPPLSLAEAPVRLDPPRAELSALAMPFGAVVAGGRAADGSASAELAIYNVYTHTFQPGLPLPEPRIAPVMAGGQERWVYLFGGLSAGAAGGPPVPQNGGWAFNTSVAPSGAYVPLDTSAASARAPASAAALGTARFLITGDPVLVVDGQPGTVVPLVDVPALGGVAVSTVHEGERYALIAGQGAGSTGAVLVADSSESGGTDTKARPKAQVDALDAPPDILRTDHAAVALSDGDVLVLAGATADGLASSAVRCAVSTRACAAEPAFLATPRRQAAVAATDAYLMVAGGIDASDGLVANAEIFRLPEGTPVATMPLAVPRTGAAAVALGNGQIALVGGVDASGQPIAVIELFTPDLD